jgi:hypothetical protein
VTREGSAPVKTSERLAFAAHPDEVGIRREARFQWDLIADRWSWSDGMYAVHGYAPGVVEPSLDLLLSYQHPMDRARTREAFSRICQDGRPFVFEHRIVTAANEVRTMILSVNADLGPGRSPLVVAGTLLDVSDARRLHHAAEQDSIAGLQVELMRLSEAARTRELISQATGVLMERHKVTADEAAALLRRASQVAGRKLPEVASELLYTGKLIGDVSIHSLRRLARPQVPARPLAHTENA